MEREACVCDHGFERSDLCAEIIIIIIIIIIIMQDSTICSRQYLHAPLLCRGALCRVSHQPGKHPSNTQVLGCEGGRATINQ